MRILITGATGFLGRYLSKKILNHNIFLTGRTPQYFLNYYQANLSNKSECEELLEIVNPDIVIHTASIAVNSPDIALFENNINIVTSLLKSIPNNCYIINTSSIVVYGDYPKRCTEESPTYPTSLYGASKLAIEGLFNSYAQTGKIKVCNLRLTALVGPRPTHGLLKAYYEKIINDEPILNGIGDSPGSVKPFTHLEDVTQAINLVLSKKLTGTYNVGPDDEISCLEVANIMMETMNRFKQVRFSGVPTVGDNKLLHISSEKIRNLGWKPLYPDSQSAIKQATQDRYGTH